MLLLFGPIRSTLVDAVRSQRELLVEDALEEPLVAWAVQRLHCRR
jgi:hypothetical protein